MKMQRRQTRKKASIYDVAAEADVSVSTVSRFMTGFPGIAPATKSRIRAAIDHLGFRPSPLARSLASRLRNSIGLIVPAGSRAYSDLFLSEVLAGVTETAGAAGWSVHLTMTPPAGDRDRLVRHADLVDASLVLDDAFDSEAVQALIASGHRILLLNRRRPRVSSVCIDNAAGARLAADHLARLGHQRIACITVEHEVAQERLEGYRSALHESGLRLVAVEDGGHEQNSARAALRRLIARPDRPTAVLVASDWMAVGVLDEAAAAGFDVPRDLSVIGFDDAIIAETTRPPLTTVRQPLAELGKAGFTALHSSILSGKKPAGTVLLTPNLTLRSSTAKPEPLRKKGV